ncbi:hypothetical protein ABI59_02365 [Acidobacteria bacterium Mor1]|nr:hypothetical protein ABI59_02365 [Acidobacteria bacterium Mor1]
MSEATPYVVALSTAGSDEQAENLARALLERRLAACVNIVGSVCSVYRWEGKVVREGEHLLVIKTSREMFPQVKATLQELHSYELPEVIMLPVLDGDAGYLDWLGKQLGKPAGE